MIDPKEKEIVAHHEAGHALVAESRKRVDRVTKISVIPRGIAALGYTQRQPTEDRYRLAGQTLRTTMTQGIKKTNSQIHHDVLAELK